jgi:hypothetical protein
MNGLVYEDIPRYDLWLKLVLGGVLAFTFILGLVLLFDNLEAAMVVFGVTVIDAFLFWTILPRRFQIYEDRIKIVFGAPLSINIPFQNIAELKAAPSSKAFFYWGLRFATSMESMVEIVRRNGLNLLISPRNGDTFIEQFNRLRAGLAQSS